MEPGSKGSETDKLNSRCPCMVEALYVQVKEYAGPVYLGLFQRCPGEFLS